MARSGVACQLGLRRFACDRRTDDGASFSFVDSPLQRLERTRAVFATGRSLASSSPEADFAAVGANFAYLVTRLVRFTWYCTCTVLVVAGGAGSRWERHRDALLWSMGS